MDDLAADLLDQYRRALSTLGPDELWRLFVGHDWYRTQLRIRARIAVRNSGGSAQWVEDVEHEALLLFSRKLKRTPHLHLDPTFATRTFAAWLGTVIYRDCLEAIRKLRRLHETHRQAPGHVVEFPVEEEPSLVDDRIDVSLAMHALPLEQQHVVILYSKGYNTRDIAQEIGITYAQARYRLRLGLERLKGALGEAFGDAD